jgi:hypothetical protein
MDMKTYVVRDVPPDEADDIRHILDRLRERHFVEDVRQHGDSWRVVARDRRSHDAMLTTFHRRSTD